MKCTAGQKHNMASRLHGVASKATKASIKTKKQVRFKRVETENAATGKRRQGERPDVGGTHHPRTLSVASSQPAALCSPARAPPPPTSRAPGRSSAGSSPGAPQSAPRASTCACAGAAAAAASPGSSAAAAGSRSGAGPAPSAPPPSHRQTSLQACQISCSGDVVSSLLPLLSGVFRLQTSLQTW